MQVEWFVGAVWFGYLLLGWPLMVNGNLELKLRWWRPYIVLSGVLFLWGMLLTGFPILMVALVAPLIAGITWLNLRIQRFCLSCGANLWLAVVSTPRVCPTCGAERPTQRSRAAS